MRFYILILSLLLVVLAVMPAQAASLTSTLSTATLTEGDGQKDFRIKLSVKPDPDQVQMNWSTNNQCEVGHEGLNFSNAGSFLSTGDDFGFSVRAVDDSIGESTHSCTVTYSTSSSNSAVNGLSLTQTFTIKDDGDAPVANPGFSTKVLGPSSIREGSSFLYSFAIQPLTAPRDSITIAATPNSQCQLVIGQTVEDYQEVVIPAGSTGDAVFSVRTTNDDVVEGTHSCTVSHTLRTTDTDYSGLTINNTQVPIIDDEAAFDSLIADVTDLVDRFDLGLLDPIDANGDGLADDSQLNVQTFINSVSGRRHSISVEGVGARCDALSSPVAVEESKLSITDKNHHYPHGLFAFRIVCDQPGATAQVTILLDSDYNTDGLNLVKYSQDDGYVVLEEFTLSKFSTGKGNVTRIDYLVADGSNLDEDGKADSVINDPIGIAISAIEEASNLPAFSQNSDNNNDRFPIATFAIPLLFLAVATAHHIRKVHTI